MYFHESLLISAPFLSGLFLSVPVQLALKRFSCKGVFGLVAGLSTLATAALPFAVEAGFPFTVLVRLLQGVVFTMLFPIIGAMLTYWTTLAENGVFMSFFMGMIQLSAMVSVPASALLTRTYGWPLTFYAHSSMGLLMWLLWVFHHK